MVISSYNWDHPQVRGVLFFHHFRNRCLHALQKCQCLAGGGQRGAAGGTPSLQGRPPLTMAPCVPPSGLPLTAASSAEERVETGLAVNDSQTPQPLGAHFHAGIWTVLPPTVPSLPESYRLPKGCPSAFSLFGAKETVRNF